MAASASASNMSNKYHEVFIWFMTQMKPVVEQLKKLNLQGQPNGNQTLVNFLQHSRWNEDWKNRSINRDDLEKHLYNLGEELRSYAMSDPNTSSREISREVEVEMIKIILEFREKAKEELGDGIYLYGKETRKSENDKYPPQIDFGNFENLVITFNHMLDRELANTRDPFYINLEKCFNIEGKHWNEVYNPKLLATESMFQAVNKPQGNEKTRAIREVGEMALQQRRLHSPEYDRLLVSIQKAMVQSFEEGGGRSVIGDNLKKFVKENTVKFTKEKVDAFNVAYEKAKKTRASKAAKVVAGAVGAAVEKVLK